MQNNRKIAYWLLAGCVLIFAMMQIGAATRLTGSGLSIVNWDLVIGTVPPLNHHQWMEAFNAYKTSPQYKDVNEGMSLASFKSIFWWEYSHRLLGRFIGMFFIFQLAFFYFKRELTPKMVKKYILIILWVGGVGAWGWFMVKSGLINVPRVSPYRLAIHLSLALSLYSFILWTVFSLRFPERTKDLKAEDQHILRKYATIIFTLLGIQIFFGGLMSGLRAALTFHSFPLMDGRFVPHGLFRLSPFVINFFENANLVNFIHRTLPYLLTLLIIIFWWKGRKIYKSRRMKWTNNLMLVMIFVQITLGALTVLNSFSHVPVGFGVAHQAGAVILLTLIVIMTNQLQAVKTGTSVVSNS